MERRILRFPGFCPWIIREHRHDFDFHRTISMYHWYIFPFFSKQESNKRWRFNAFVRRTLSSLFVFVVPLFGSARNSLAWSIKYVNLFRIAAKKKKKKKKGDFPIERKINKTLLTNPLEILNNFIIMISFSDVNWLFSVDCHQFNITSSCYDIFHRFYSIPGASEM